MGLLAPSSTYHHFAVGLTGEKMRVASQKQQYFSMMILVQLQRKSRRLILVDNQQ